MRKFYCLICGYIHDEAEGCPESGVAAQTKWEDIPAGYCCSRCGAPKSAFAQMSGGDSQPAAQPAPDPGPVSDSPPDDAQHSEDLRELSDGELSAIFSNLAKGCQKQYLEEQMELFNRLADYFKDRVTAKGGGLEELSGMVKADLDGGFKRANSASSDQADRGALRALVWGEKVSRGLDYLLSRYAQEGDAMLEDNKIYVCDICGFVYVGNNLPEVCPICKVPNFKISPVQRR